MKQHLAQGYTTVKLKSFVYNPVPIGHVSNGCG